MLFHVLLRCIESCYPDTMLKWFWCLRKLSCSATKWSPKIEPWGSPWGSPSLRLELIKTAPVNVIAVSGGHLYLGQHYWHVAAKEWDVSRRRWWKTQTADRGLWREVDQWAFPQWHKEHVFSGERLQTEVGGLRGIWSPVCSDGGEERWDDSEDQRRARGEARLHQRSEEETQWAPGDHRQAAGGRHPDAGRVRDGRVPAGECDGTWFINHTSNELQEFFKCVCVKNHHQVTTRKSPAEMFQSPNFSQSTDKDKIWKFKAEECKYLHKNSAIKVWGKHQNVLRNDGPDDLLCVCPNMWISLERKWRKLTCAASFLVPQATKPLLQRWVWSWDLQLVKVMMELIGSCDQDRRGNRHVAPGEDPTRLRENGSFHSQLRPSEDSANERGLHQM